MAKDPSSVADLERMARRNQKLTALLDVAKALIEERHIDPLLDLIMRASVRTVDAERCTLFLMARDGKELWSKIAHGLEDERIIRLPVGQGIAGQVAQSAEPLNIPDAYADPRFNREVDVDTGYRTSSILCVPMLGRDKHVVGVVQALNHRGGPFNAEDQELLMALGANAAAAIENANLYEDIERLFEGFVTAAVTAIEARDPTTSGHSERVAALSVQCLEVLPRADAAFKSLEVTAREIRELRYAALLHDFGKVGVRENVLVKADKLYPHQLQLLEARFSEARHAREIAMLRARIEAEETLGRSEARERVAQIEAEWRRQDEEYGATLEFIRRCNRPTVLEQGGFERLHEIATMAFQDRAGLPKVLLTPQELENLSIARGSLNAVERKEIESHVIHTYNFLRQIPWTRELARIPEIAGGHHEKLDGSGYPRGIGAAAIPVQTRIMTIADIYDALTAADRPYKAALPHERALDILADEARRGHIDPGLLRVFIEAEVPRRALHPSTGDLPRFSLPRVETPSRPR